MEQIFSPRTILLFNLFNNNHNHNPHHEYINNITGIAGDVGLSLVTIRKHLTRMVGVGILRELVVGKNGKVFTVNRDSAITKALTALIDVMEEKERFICGEEKCGTYSRGEGR